MISLCFPEIRTDQKKTFSYFAAKVSKTLKYFIDIYFIKLSSCTDSSMGEVATSSYLACIAHCFNPVDGSVQFSSVTQSCPTLWDPVDCSPPGSSVHGILQARIPEWVVIPLSKGSSQPRDRTQVSCVVGRFFTI